MPQQVKLTSYGDALICPLCGRHKKAEYELCYNCFLELKEDEEDRRDISDCKYRYNDRCSLDKKYCSEMGQFSLNCYEREDVK